MAKTTTRTPRRAATSLVEGLAAAALALLVLGLIAAAARLVSRGTKSPELASSARDARVALAWIRRDVLRLARFEDLAASDEALELAVRPDPAHETPVTVRYRVVAQNGGTVSLVREEGRERRALPGRFALVRFHRPGGAGGMFVRVSIHAESAGNGPACTASALMALGREPERPHGSRIIE